MPVDYEHREQAALFDWIEMRAARYPELALAFAVPNGGKRGKATAAKLKKEGLIGLRFVGAGRKQRQPSSST